MQDTGNSKKEEFQRYLEKAGVIDHLTKVLVGLYEVPEKPSNAMKFVVECLNGPSQRDSNAEIEDLKTQLAAAQEKIANLEKQLAEKSEAAE